MTFQTDLKKLCACSEAVDWVGGRDLSTAWEECANTQWAAGAAGDR